MLHDIVLAPKAKQTMTQMHNDKIDAMLTGKLQNTKEDAPVNKQ